MAKLQKICLRFIAAVGGILFLVLTIYAWRYTMQIGLHSESLTDGKDSLLRNFLLLLLAVEIAFRLNTWKKYLTAKRVHRLAVFASVFVTLVSFKLVWDANGMTECDQLHVYMAAEDICNQSGERFVTGDDYFYCSPHQLGLAAIYGFFMKLTGVDSEDLLRSIHALCAGLCVYMGFRITRELSDDRRAEILYLLGMVSFLPLYLYVLFVYGETIGICGALCAIWFFLRANRERPNRVLPNWLAFGLCMAVTYIARKGLIILWIAMAIVQIFWCLQNHKKIFLLFMAGVLAFMLGSQNLLIRIAEDRMGADFGSGVSLVSWLAMGMQDYPDGSLPPGSYNGYHVEVYREANYDVEAASAVSRQYIEERITQWSKNPGDAVRFYKMKILSQWNETTYGAFLMTGLMDEPAAWIQELYYGDERQGWTRWLDAFQGVTYLLVFGFFVRLLSGREKPEQYLPGLILIGGFCFSVIWETKSRYIYPYSVMAIPCAAISLVYYYDRMPGLVRMGMERIKQIKIIKIMRNKGEVDSNV